jgi:hypothetical protein
LLPAENDIQFLKVGGEGEPVQFRPGGEGTADIPGIHRAANRAMHQMQGIGDRIENYSRATENAGTLTDRPGEALLVTVEGKRGTAFAVDLPATALQGGCIVHYGSPWLRKRVYGYPYIGKDDANL